MIGSVLNGFSEVEVVHEPYAHVVRDRPISEDLYQKLSHDFPPLERFLEGNVELKNNQAIRIPARLVIDDTAFSPEWREFFRYHTSAEFWRELIYGLGAAFRAAHPLLETCAGKSLEDWTVKLRGTEGVADVELDALFVINTPVEEESSVRPAHVDARDKIWVGLYYLRDNEDSTPGGDFTLYRFRQDQKPGFGGPYAALDRLAQCHSISYQANRFLTFVNSPASIHGVTPRLPTPRCRRYISLIAKTPFENFDLPPLPLLTRFKLWRQRRNTRAGGVTHV